MGMSDSVYFLINVISLFVFVSIQAYISLCLILSVCLSLSLSLFCFSPTLSFSFVVNICLTNKMYIYSLNSSILQ